jgi:hypothetical protein
MLSLCGARYGLRVCSTTPVCPFIRSPQAANHLDGCGDPANLLSEWGECVSTCKSGQRNEISRSPQKPRANFIDISPAIRSIWLPHAANPRESNSIRRQLCPPSTAESLQPFGFATISTQRPGNPDLSILSIGGFRRAGVGRVHAPRSSNALCGLVSGQQWWSRLSCSAERHQRILEYIFK